MKYRVVCGSVLVPGLLAAASPLAGCGSSGSGGPPAEAGAVDSATDSTVPDGGRDGANDARADGTMADVSSSDAMNSDGDAGENGEGGDAGQEGSFDATPDRDAGDAGATVSFAIDPSRGPTRQHKPPSAPVAVSPYIYGINASGQSGATGAFTQRKTRWGLVRKGSNAFTAWNWTNNYYNLGNTDCFWQGPAPGGPGLAATVTQDTDSIGAAQAEGAAYLATVPIVDHVAATQTNLVDGGSLCPFLAGCDGGATQSTTNVNSNNLDFATTDPASSAFVANAPRKPGAAYCTCAPGAACDGGCTVSTNPVYQDEFVNFLKQGYAGAGDAGAAPVFFDLDNEPNYWGYTHPEVWPATAPPPCGDSTVTFDDIVTHDIPFAQAIKAAWPSALVFGPVASQDGIVYAHSYDSDPHYPTEFVDYYLGQMAAASADAGTPLLDVLDVHYYNGATNGGPTSQCLQHPRMFWDPQFTALSPTATDAVDFGYSGKGPNSDYFDTAWYPRQLIPRLLTKIDTAYGASTSAPQLSFSEYNSGCETDIAGGLAEADDLGIFGREGVFAAAAMTFAPAATNYLVAAFDLYRNYDGNGAVVGDTAIAALTSGAGTVANGDTTSVYAFAHSEDAAAIDVVVINKAATTAVATLSIASAVGAFTTVKAYQLAAGTVGVTPLPANATPPIACASGACTLTYAMPPLSATTFVVR